MLIHCARGTGVILGLGLFYFGLLLAASACIH